MTLIRLISYVLGSEVWGDDFSSLLSIVKEFIVDVWESRKLRLYGENACPGPIIDSLLYIIIE